MSFPLADILALAVSRGRGRHGSLSIYEAALKQSAMMQFVGVVDGATERLRPPAEPSDMQLSAGMNEHRFITSAVLAVLF